MFVSSSLVNVTEDAELRLVNLLAEAAPADLLGISFQADCSSSISAGDAAALLKIVVKDVGAVSALTVLETDEATAAVSILAALLQRSDNPQLAQSLADAIVQTKDDGSIQAAKRKILLLSVLYNMRSEPAVKCGLLTKMFQLAGSHADQLLAPESSLGSLLLSSESSSSSPAALVALLDSWQIPLKDRREIYDCVASVLPSDDLRRQRLLLLLAESYNNETSPVDAKGVQAAKDVTIGAIRDPVSLFAQQRNLLQQASVQALEKQDAKLVGLLRVFQEGKISDYEEFIQKNGGEDAVLKPLGLEADRCQRHMRILSLCSLASEHDEIPYSVVSETLKLSGDNSEVERWVIAAVGSGLLQAKMDQLQEKVMVERCVVRQFDQQQWKALQTRLVSWKENIGGILKALKESQEGHVPVN